MEKDGEKSQKKELCRSEFTDIVGGNGKWQIKLLLVTLISGFGSAWNHLGMAFLALPEDHWCARPAGSNISLETWFTEYLPNTTIKGKVQHSQCEIFIMNQSDENPVTKKTEYCNAWEYSADINTVVQQWDIVCDKDWMLSTSQSVYMLGFLLTVCISGQLADLYGRRPTTLCNVLILLIGGITAAYSNSFIMFTVCRFFIGFGYAGVELVLFVFFIEVVGPQYRAKYSIIRGFGWHIGYLSLPLVAWAVPDWFYLQLAATLPSIFLISYYWYLLESPRWLLTTGKINEAIHTMKVIAKGNGIKVNDIEEEVKKICFTENDQNKLERKITFIDLLRPPKLRCKMLFQFFIWITITFVYYGLSLNTNDLDGNVYLNFFLCGLMEIPATLFCIFTLDRFGRRKPLTFTLLLGGLACLGCILIPQGFPDVKTALAMLGKFFVTAAFSIVYVFSAELIPTVARNIGVGSCSTMGRIGSLVAPFMRDLGKVTNPTVPDALFGVLSILSGGIVYLLPETNNLPIVETIDQAEQFGKKDKFLDPLDETNCIVNMPESV